MPVFKAEYQHTVLPLFYSFAKYDQSITKYNLNINICMQDKEVVLVVLV
jgi:hypothetical protein